MEIINVVIFEDNESYRTYLCNLFEFETGIVLKGAFSNCNKCVEQAEALKPDVVLMDLKMPNDNDGLEGLKKLKAAFPAIHVIMLTDSDKPNDIFNCIQAKPSGYINKRKTNPSQIINSVKTATQNNEQAAPVYSNDIITQLTEFIQAGAPQNENNFGLTPTEMQVLQLLADGKSEKLIADALKRGIETAHKHKQNIYRKLDVHNETEAVKFARDHRLLPAEMLRHKS
ncbi:MAG: response regulator transcription factor [Bacteroidota bacterium]